MKVDPLLLLAIVQVAIVAAAFAFRRRHQRVLARRIDDGFDALAFETPAGEVPGRDMRIVKSTRQARGFRRDAATDSTVHYCVGPGPCWFMALSEPAPGSLFGAKRVWIVRPLTAERMRAALVDDPGAQHAAFGDVIGDRLRA